MNQVYRPISQCTSDYLLLIRETEVNTEGREDKALKLALCLETIAVLAESSDILSIQVDQVGAVGLDTGRGHGLGQDGGSTGNCN